MLFLVFIVHIFLTSLSLSCFCCVRARCLEEYTYIKYYIQMNVYERDHVSEIKGKARATTARHSRCRGRRSPLVEAVVTVDQVYFEPHYAIISGGRKCDGLRENPLLSLDRVRLEFQRTRNDRSRCNRSHGDRWKKHCRSLFAHVEMIDICFTFKAD